MTSVWPFRLSVSLSQSFVESVMIMVFRPCLRFVGAFIGRLVPFGVEVHVLGTDDWGRYWLEKSSLIITSLKSDSNEKDFDLLVNGVMTGHEKLKFGNPHTQQIQGNLQRFSMMVKWYQKLQYIEYGTIGHDGHTEELHH